MSIYISLFKTFFKIGAFTFGGGYAMIPLIEEEIVDKKGWIEREEIMDLFAIAQSIPGAIAINTATLVGYKKAGKRGGICATFGVILPSFIIISIIAAFFASFAHLPLVHAIFMGINGAVVLLILKAALKMTRLAVVDVLSGLSMLMTVLMILFTSINPIIMILAGASIGLIRYFIEKKA